MKLGLPTAVFQMSKLVFFTLFLAAVYSQDCEKTFEECLAEDHPSCVSLVEADDRGIDCLQIHEFMTECKCTCELLNDCDKKVRFVQICILACVCLFFEPFLVCLSKLSCCTFVYSFVVIGALYLACEHLEFFHVKVSRLVHINSYSY